MYLLMNLINREKIPAKVVLHLQLLLRIKYMKRNHVKVNKIKINYHVHYDPC